MSDDNVIKLADRGLITYADEPPEQVLEKAKGWGMRYCIIIGEDEKGELRWGGSTSDGQLINMMLDLAKYDLLHTKAYNGR